MKMGKQGNQNHLELMTQLESVVVSAERASEKGEIDILKSAPLELFKKKSESN